MEVLMYDSRIRKQTGEEKGHKFVFFLQCREEIMTQYLHVVLVCTVNKILQFKLQIQLLYQLPRTCEPINLLQGISNADVFESSLEETNRTAARVASKNTTTCSLHHTTR